MRILQEDIYLASSVQPVRNSSLKSSVISFYNQSSLFVMMMKLSLPVLCCLFTLLSLCEWVVGWPAAQSRAATIPPWAGDKGHNHLYVPTPSHIFPGKRPFIFDAKRHYYEQHHNNEMNGTYKRACKPFRSNSCLPLFALVCIKACLTIERLTETGIC